MQKRALGTKWHPSTKHLVQPLGTLAETPIRSDSCLAHVPQPTWATIKIPDLEGTLSDP